MNENNQPNNIQEQDLVSQMNNDVASEVNKKSGGLFTPSSFFKSSNDDQTKKTNDVAQSNPVVDSQASTSQPQIPSSDSAQNDLHDIKHQALQELNPLINHIDQDPEERFETLLMMIRASDDTALIKPAYEAALAIEDKERKAKALLNVINEINYLTRPKDDKEDQ